MENNDRFKGLRNFAARLYAGVDKLSGGSIGVLADALRRFNQNATVEAAAGLAFFALLAIFPMLLSLVALLSFFLSREQILSDVFLLVHTLVLFSPDLIINNITQVLQKRSAFGLVGIVGLLYSASGVFAILFRNVNRAWPQARPLNDWRSRLLGVVLIVVVSMLALLALAASAILNLFYRLGLLLPDGITAFGAPLAAYIPQLIPWLVLFVVFLGLYRFIPSTHVRWVEATWSALAAALAVQVSTMAFGLYLNSSFVHYQNVYGSLGALVAFLFWLYLDSLVVLFCAHIGPAIAYRTRYKPQPVVQEPADPSQPLPPPQPDKKE